MGIFDHSSRSTFVRSDTDVGREGLARSLRSNSSQRCSIGLRSGLCRPVKFFHSHVGTGRGHPQTVPTKLGAWNCPKSLGMLKHSEFLSLELRGQAQLLKNNPTPWSPLHQTSQLAQCSQTSTVILETAKPRLVHQIARWRSVICHSRERISTALESSGGVLYTTASNALHCTWWCMAWMQLLGHGNPFHEALYALFLS